MEVKGSTAIVYMKIQFRINEVAIINDIFSLNNSCRQKGKELLFSGWVNVENKIYEDFKNNPAYYLINPTNINWALKQIFTKGDSGKLDKIFLEISKTLKKIYDDISKTPEFKKIISEVEEYRKFVEKQWSENEEFIIDYFQNTLGIEIPNYTIIIYIFHPKSFNGNANHNEKIILWGHSEDWKNYSSVYLAHEILHILVSEKMKNHNIMHAIIELATDNELRVRLDKNAKYFNMDPLPPEAPSWAKEKEQFKKTIFPYWKKYLESQQERNIFDLENEMTKLITL